MRVLHFLRLRRVEGANALLQLLLLLLLSAVAVPVPRPPVRDDVSHGGGSAQIALTDMVIAEELPGTVCSLWRQQLASGADDVALIEGSRRLTYAEVDQLVTETAFTLFNLYGVRPGDRVIVSLDSSIELVVAMLALFSMGAVYIPVTPDTPLARMRLEIELSQVSDETRAAIDEDLAQIDHSIGQLMEYARPATAVPEHGIDVSAVLNDVYERERTHTESLGGILTASVEPNLYARISAHDLKRIVSNLIENARRYGRSPEDDRARIELSAHQHGNILVIAVKDQGAGIAKGDIQRLLRPFSRGVSARTGVSGAGLGLAIVERLLGQVGGHFELVSAPSEGLTARIQLPRIRASRNAPGTQADKDSKAS